MTRSHAGAKLGRTRRRIASIAGLVALLGALLVTVAAPAHALSPCTATDPYCPVANVDEYTVNFGTKLVVDAAHGLLANDHGPASTHVSTALGDTDTDTFNSATVHVKSDGSFTYTPNPDPAYAFSGQDSFEYTIEDNNPDDDQDFNDVLINVVPVVRNDVYSMHSDQPLIVGMPGVLANDGGIDPDSLVFPTEAQHGLVNDAGEGAFVYTPLPGFAGTDTFQYTGNDLDFDPDVYIGTVTIYVDGTPPVATMSAPGLVTLGTKVPVAWSATDPGGTEASGVASYDTQYKVAPWNGPFGAWTALKTATVAKSDTVAGTYGRTFCFRVRAKDRAGNYSPFTAQRCTSIPLRARSLSYSANWSRVASPLYFTGEAFTTKSYGQNATLPAVQAQHIWLVATKCSTCGTVQVRWNNVVVATASLASPVTVRHVLVPIVAASLPKVGTLLLHVVSPNGKPVIIEGLAVLRA